MTFENLSTVPVSQKKESVLAFWRRMISWPCHKHYLLPSCIQQPWMNALLPNGKEELAGIWEPGSRKLLCRVHVIDVVLMSIYTCMCACICINRQVHTKYLYLRNRNYLDYILCKMCFQKLLQVKLQNI